MKNVIKLSVILPFLVFAGSMFLACPDPSSSDPKLDGSVSISGIAQVGQTLTANTVIHEYGGTGNGLKSGINFTWKRGGSTHIGTNRDTYTVQVADIGSTITVTMTRNGYTGSATSSATSVVTTATLPVLTGTVSISGTAQVGQTLAANTSPDRYISVQD